VNAGDGFKQVVVEGKVNERKVGILKSPQDMKEIVEIMYSCPLALPFFNPFLDWRLGGRLLRRCPLSQYTTVVGKPIIYDSLYLIGFHYV